MKQYLVCFILLFFYQALTAQCPGSSLCSICQADLSVTDFSGGNILNATSTIPGTILAGGAATGDTIVVEVNGCGEIDITVELDFVWEQGSGINWIHGVSFQASDGWSAAEVILPTNDWIFQDTITGACFNQPFGAGYYYDPVGDGCGGGDNSSWNGTNCGGTFCEEDDPWLTDGEPFDNWGDDCEFNCPEFGFELSFCPAIAEVTTETIGFFITDDAQSGGWQTDDGCIFDLNFVIQFVPAVLSEEVNSCIGECVTLDAGSGCDSYIWNTGETSQSITVCPIVETDYIISASSSNGCVIVDTITVIPEFCCNSFAGEINANNACPGQTIDVDVVNFQDSIGYDQYTIITDGSGIILDIILDSELTLTSEVCSVFTIYAYNHYTGDASPVPMIGDDVNTYNCVDNCCDITSLTVSFEDDEPPVFDMIPADEEIECLSNLAPSTDLNWTDNCGLTGISPITSELNNATICAGGSVERTWNAIDSCDNLTTHTQTITVLPLAPPMFLNPPSDEVHPCGFIPITSDLSYENGLTGSCEDSGVAIGVLSGSQDICGGSYTIVWEYTDMCNQTASHTQNITIEPAPEAVFLNVPPAMTYTCETVPTSFPDLDYTNNLTGTCEIMGSEPAVTTGTFDICGGMLMNTWEFTDACGRTITETQIITIEPAPEASFINPPAGVTLDCDQVPQTMPVLDYDNGLIGTCEISGMVNPVVNSSVDVCGGQILNTWEFTDVCGRPISHTQMIIVNPAPIPSFLNPPTDITVSCGSVPSTSSLLSYSNGITGSCEISGDIMGVLGTFDPCTGTITEDWNVVDECGNPLNHSRTITVDDIGPIEFETVPGSVTLSCDEVELNLMDLNFSNNSTGVCLLEGSVAPTQSGSFNSCGGNLTLTWETMDACGNLISVSQNIIVEPAPEATFENVPTNQTISCDNLTTPPNLNVSNGLSGVCGISDIVIPTIQDNFDACGGEIIYTWTYIDPCGRSISTSQTITVTEAPAPVFTNPPPDITIECNEVGGFINFLNYSNGENPPCQITGNGIAIETGTYDLCGGQLTQSWSETDDCGNVLNHVRTITVNPTTPAIFINPPPDITLNCGQDYTPPDNLLYSNNDIGNCLIAGDVQAEVVQNGEVFTHTWTFTNPCSFGTIEHVQTVTLSPDLDLTVEPTFISICLGESFDLGTINISDANNQDFDVEYYEGFPSTVATLITNLVVSPNTSTIYTIRVFNDLGCLEEIAITISVDEPPFAGNDNLIELCNPDVINLVELLGPNSTPGGTWQDLDGANVNLDNPLAIVFGNQTPGIYDFSYTVQSGNTCPPDEAIISVNFFELPPIIIDTIYCTNNNTTYTIELNSSGSLILASEGNVIDLGGGVVIITDIPIDLSVDINNLDPINQCVGFLSVNPPDCNCPSVEPPTGNNITVCESDGIAVLHAEKVDGLIIHWYANETDETPILSGVDSLIIDNLEQGIFSYYIETESIEFPGCFSPFRIEVSLEVVASPPINDIGTIDFCIDVNELSLIHI